MQKGSQNPQNMAIHQLLQESLNEEMVWGEKEKTKIAENDLPKYKSVNRTKIFRKTNREDEWAQMRKTNISGTRSTPSTPNSPSRIRMLNNYKIRAYNSNSMNYGSLAEIPVRNFSEEINSESAGRKRYSHSFFEKSSFKGIMNKLYKKTDNHYFSETQRMKDMHVQKKTLPKPYSSYWVDKMKDKRKQISKLIQTQAIREREGEILGKKLKFIK